MGKGHESVKVASSRIIDYRSLNEQQVEDITLEFFYKPHTLTLLVTVLVGLLYTACVRDNTDEMLNIYHGALTISGMLVLPISLLLFPNGPFTRPHPAFWRICYGAALWYLFFLIFILFLNIDQVRAVQYYLDPSLRDAKREIDVVESYASDCSNVTIQTIWDSLDIFAFAHFWGWGMKALMIRNYGFCWVISVTWELTEIQFTHILPNFEECWWDHWILDVLICNGGGIWLGMQVTKYFEMRKYRWESVLDIDSKTKKIKRCILQFTPESWSPVNWIRGGKPTLLSRAFSIFCLSMLWQIIELNTFFSKHFFRYPGSHFYCWGRILFLGLISCPAIKQYYSYATDSRCKRLGNHAWLFIAITLIESIVNIKYGYSELTGTNQWKVIQWVFIMALGSIVGLFICLLAGQKVDYEKEEKSEEPNIHEFESEMEATKKIE